MVVPPSRDLTRRERILCVCKNGNVRSVALARMLRRRGKEALSVGFSKVTADTLAMLTNWAERIYVAEPYILMQLPIEDRPKVDFSMVVGPDDWLQPGHPGLTSLYRRLLGDPI